MNIIDLHRAAGYPIIQKSATEYASGCPWCGSGTDRFIIWPNAKPGGKCHCRVCMGDLPKNKKTRDIIDYLKLTREIDFKTARRMVGDDSSLNGSVPAQPAQQPAPAKPADDPAKARYIYSRLNWKDQTTIRRYFQTRGLIIDPGTCKQLGARVSRYNDELGIVIPIRNPQGEIGQLQKIILNEDFTKKEKRLIGRYTGDRGLLIRRSPERLVITEGLEDMLTLLLKVRTDASLLCSFGTAGFSRIGGFIEQYPNVVCILDNDSNGASVKASSKLPQGVKRLMPAMMGIDANRALQQGILGDWIKSLKEIKQP